MTHEQKMQQLARIEVAMIMIQQELECWRADIQHTNWIYNQILGE